MDFGTLGGFLSGILIILLSIFAGGGDITRFLHLPSFLTTFCGMIAALSIAFPFSKIFDMRKTILRVLYSDRVDFSNMISILVGFSEKARREGLLALEDDVAEVNEDFLKKGIQLVVDGTDPDLLRSIMIIDLEKLEERHKVSKDLYDMAASIAPAFGMIGTLMGLITMLANLADKSSIGSGMALALITTFYGAVLSNLVFGPIAKKLEIRSQEEVLLKEIILEGILSIQSGDNPRIVKDKLTSFLSPDIRKNVALEI